MEYNLSLRAEIYLRILECVDEMKRISYVTTNPNKGKKYHNLRRLVKRYIMVSHGDEFLKLVNGNQESEYAFEIVKCEYDGNVLFTVRVADDNVHHNHKRGEHFHDVKVTRDELKELFKAELHEYALEQKFKLINKINNLKMELQKHNWIFK